MPGTGPQDPPVRRRPPVVTALLIVAISTVSLVGYAHPQVMEALERRRGALGDGQWWRLVSPLLVQTDGWAVLLGGMWLLALVGLVAEPLLGHARFLAVFLDPALPGRRSGFDQLAALGAGTPEAARGRG
jgi:membrane associated rhomboid family serine protease